MQLVGIRIAEFVTFDADQELIDSLPRLPPMKGAFQEYIDAEIFDAIGTSRAEREAGIKIEFHVLHLPGRWPSCHLFQTLVSILSNFGNESACCNPVLAVSMLVQVAAASASKDKTPLPCQASQCCGDTHLASAKRFSRLVPWKI